MEEKNIEDDTKLSDLKDALKECLETRGVYGQLKAKIRAEIFHAINENPSTGRPSPSNSNLILNEVIREYLEYNGYRHALSVFISESLQPQEKPFERNFLERELKLTNPDRNLPLLYGLLTSSSQAEIGNKETKGSRRDHEVLVVNN